MTQLLAKTVLKGVGNLVDFEGTILEHVQFGAVDSRQTQFLSSQPFKHVTHILE